MIAQCLSAAQATIPASNPEFLVHSMHCYFVLAGDATIPILYHVERVRDGKSFITRTVQARQRGKCIFTTTLSFMREGSGGEKAVEHAWGMPEGVRELLDAVEERPKESEDAEGNGEQAQGPFVTRRMGVWNSKYFPRRQVPDVMRDLRLTIWGRRITSPTPQEAPAMDPLPRPDLSLQWSPSTSLRPGLHVGQLVHWDCCACPQSVALWGPFVLCQPSPIALNIYCCGA